VPARPDYKAIVDAPDRSAEDRALDAGRHPLELLSFLGLGPGMKVGEVAAGGGYTSELLARTVAPDGVVYGQNSKFILERFAEKPWSERLKKPVMKNVVRVDSDFSEPFPDTIHDLDAVINVLFYHDTVWQKADRERMNRTIFRTLRSGGQYVVVDHSARAGAGLNDVETLHRIEEALERLEEGTFGYCFECGDEIEERRLRALPFAVRCKDCEEARETAERRERQQANRRSSGFLIDLN